MDKEDNLIKLSKKELIKIIDSYKEKLVSIEEYMKIVKPNIANF
mgnify:FL=1